MPISPRFHRSMYHGLWVLALSLANASCDKNDKATVDDKKLSDLNLEEARKFCRDSFGDMGTTMREACRFDAARDTADEVLTLSECKEEWDVCAEFTDEDDIDCDQITEEDLGNDCDVTVGEFLQCFAHWAELWSDITQSLTCEKSVDGIDSSVEKKADQARNPKICEKVIKECLTDDSFYSSAIAR